jgi:AraC family transcriptional regulator
MGMDAKIIPCTKYAVFTHSGTVDRLKETYDKIYGVWLPLTGSQLAEADTLEIYTLQSSNNYKLDIYIPLRY